MEQVYKNISECCGCSLCEYICPKGAISLKTEGGFYYPVIDKDKCIDCGLCRKTCTFKDKYIEENTINQAYAAKHKNADIIKASSSGGMFTALSDYILGIGGTVYGADYDDNMHLRHTSAISSEARDRMRGAKYIQSDMSGVFADLKQTLSSGRPVLFTGTPCEVAAVKKAFGKSENLYLVDIICHGVPSAEVWKKFVDYIEKKYRKKMTYYKFRDKQNGWRGYSSRIYFKDGTEIPHNDISGSFIELFMYDVCLRESCTKCPYTSTARVGDITIGDFWGIENVMPDLSDNQGISAVMVNSEKGAELLGKARGDLELYPCKKEDIALKQPNLSKPSSHSSKAVCFKKDLAELPFDKLLKKYTRVGLKRRLIDSVKKLLKR